MEIIQEYGAHMQIILAVVTLAILILIYRKTKKRSQKNDDSPPVDPPNVVDGVYIGDGTYGDIEAGICINVKKVSNGIVFFTFLKNDGESPIKELEVEAFLTSFYHFPNGCDFSYKN